MFRVSNKETRNTYVNILKFESFGLFIADVRTVIYSISRSIQIVRSNKNVVGSLFFTNDILKIVSYFCIS